MLSKKVYGFVGTIVLVCVAAGCQTTPCKHITSAGWKCNLNVTGQYAPGDLIYVKQTSQGKQTTLLPEKAAGYQLDRRDITVADVVGKTNWSFNIGVAGAEFPGLSSVTDVNAKLKNTGFKSIDYKFTDSKMVSLKVGQDSLDSGPELLAQAKKLAAEYVEQLTPAAINSIRTQTGNKSTVWLVMQVIETNVKGELKHGGTNATEAAATVQGIGVTAGLDTDTSSTYSIATKSPQSIALRAIPLVVEGEEVGPMAAGTIRVKDGAKLQAPN